MSILVRNVKVLGGALNIPEKSDVFISGGAISAIGNFPHKTADKIIDGQGGYLAPGFIDIDSTSDHYLTLFSDPLQGNSLKQGVTTIIGGHCGASLAPLLYGDLESIKKWGNPSEINVDWHTVDEFLKLLERRPKGVNFGTLAGHSTVRRALVGEDMRDLTTNELKVFRNIFEKALNEGAFGFSVGLEYLHARQTPYSELKSIATILGDQGILSVHLRHNGEEVETAVREVIKLQGETGVSVLLPHFMPRRGAEKSFTKALELISALPKDKNFHLSAYPFAGVILSLYQMLPDWAQNGTIELMAKSVLDDWLSKRITKDLPLIDPGSLTVEASRNPILVGKTLKEFMEFSGIEDPRQGLLELMRATKLNAVVLWESVNEDILGKVLNNPRTLIGSHSAAFLNTSLSNGLHVQRSSQTFAVAIQNAKDEDDLKRIIKSITETPAQKLRLKDRGVVREGFIADLVVLKDGVRDVILNGKLVVENGVALGLMEGKVLRP